MLCYLALNVFTVIEVSSGVPFEHVTSKISLTVFRFI